MLIRLALVIEIISMVICIHHIYGKKIHWDILTIGLVITLLIILDVINTLQINKTATCLVYILIFIYCKLKFKNTFIRTGISVIFLTIIVSTLQFICLALFGLILPENEMARVLLADTGALVCCKYLLPKMKIDVLLKDFRYAGKVVLVILAIVSITVIFLLMQDKIFKGIRADMFIFTIPMALIVVLLIGKWNSSKKDIEQVEKELETNVHMQSSFESLLEDVRLRQHEFKNHMAAILSAHYTYKTYKKLVQAQSEYCNKLSRDNKYNNLLLIKNNILSGFFYEKFKEIEADAKEFEYKIHGTFGNIQMPTYHLIEIIGILIDNAVEAIKNDDDKMISIEAHEDEKRCYFLIRNTHEYVTYATIAQWFQKGISTKGANRGIGLYHVKTLCEEWDSNIRCENVFVDDKNWIQFTLEINKAAN